VELVLHNVLCVHPASIPQVARVHVRRVLEARMHWLDQVYVSILLLCLQDNLPRLQLDSLLDNLLDSLLDNPLDNLLGNLLEFLRLNLRLNLQVYQLDSLLDNPLDSLLDNPLDNLLGSLLEFLRLNLRLNLQVYQLDSLLEFLRLNLRLNLQGSQLDSLLVPPPACLLRNLLVFLLRSLVPYLQCDQQASLLPCLQCNPREHLQGSQRLCPRHLVPYQKVQKGHIVLHQVQVPFLHRCQLLLRP
jgi:hypothetical protein